jgi:hypothetical protein
MSKSMISDTGKRPPGRPAVGSTGIMVRVPPTELEPIDAWIKVQPKPRPSRPEAIRRLVEMGLKAKKT